MLEFWKGILYKTKNFILILKIKKRTLMATSLYLVYTTLPVVYQFRPYPL
jgi:hypothetical protein